MGIGDLRSNEIEHADGDCATHRRKEIDAIGDGADGNECKQFGEQQVEWIARRMDDGQQWRSHLELAAVAGQHIGREGEQIDGKGKEGDKEAGKQRADDGVRG